MRSVRRRSGKKVGSPSSGEKDRVGTRSASRERIRPMSASSSERDNAVSRGSEQQYAAYEHELACTYHGNPGSAPAPAAIGSVAVRSTRTLIELEDSWCLFRPPTSERGKLRGGGWRASPRNRATGYAIGVPGPESGGGRRAVAN